MKSDVIVLGAGMVGVSAALHLQKRGRSVALVDRRGAAEETSYGNTGIIQGEAVVPYPFPREWGRILRYALNRSTESNLHWRSLPWLAPALFRYWRNSTPERIERSARALKPLVDRAIEEHEALMQEAGIAGMLRRTGYLRVYRSAKVFAEAIRSGERTLQDYGVRFEAKDDPAVQQLEPHLTGTFVGGMLMPQPISVADPSAVGKAYAEQFTRAGGRFVMGDARTLGETATGWRVRSADDAIEAREVVIALGPWSDEVLTPLGVRVPLAVKRGYHMHFSARGNANLSRPVIDVEFGYALTPMTRGIRLTTGAEFAPRDAPPTPVQLDRAEPIARAIFPLDGRVDAKPWLGARPFLPDMLPLIGRVPGKNGLWLDFGHHHLGFTLGPVTGRLLAEMMTGGDTFTDPSPYRLERF